VSSCVWSVILVLFCVPWSDMTGVVPIPGVFRTYEAVVEQSLGVMGGEQSSAVLHLYNVLIPALAIACAIGVGFSFRAGVERGIIVTALSEFDRAIEREITSLQENGIGARQPKVLGALYRAIGDEAQDGSAKEEEPMRGRSAGVGRESPRDDALRNLRQADPGRPLPRPI